MGRKQLGEAEIGPGIMQEESSNLTANWNHTNLYETWYGVDITWGRELHLTGSYRIDLTISDDEILYLFKLKFGDELTPEKLSSLGITLTEVKPSQESLNEALSNMTVGEFLELVARK